MKILMISNHLGVQSGVQRYVQNLLLHLDTAKYRVTLFVGQCPPDQASTAPALEAHGVEILAVPDNKKDRIRALAAHLRTHKDYDIIHYHTASKIGAPVCGMMRVLCPRAKIVVHSHIVYPPMTLTWRAAHLVYQLFADYFLGCGVAAGRFVFGDHIDAKPNFSVACNAVDAGRFDPGAAPPAPTPPTPAPHPTPPPTDGPHPPPATPPTAGKEDGRPCPPARIPADVRGRPATLPPPAGRPYKRPTCREQPGNRPAARCRTPCADGWRDARIRGFAHAGHVSA